MAPLCEPFHDVLTEARARAHERNPELADDPALASVLTHLTRGLALAALRKRDLGPWKLGPQNNAGIALARDSYELRVLHQLPDKSTPPPGHSKVRTRFYTNETLDPDLFPAGDRLIALWGASPQGALTIRIVRPIGSWSFGSRQKVDMDFVLPAVAEDLNSLIYDTIDDDIVVTIPREEDGTNVQRRLRS